MREPLTNVAPSASSANSASGESGESASCYSYACLEDFQYCHVLINVFFYFVPDIFGDVMEDKNEVTAPAECICSPILSAFPIDNREIEYRNEFCQWCLLFIKGFCSREVGQILMIRVDLDSMFRSREAVFPFSTGFDSSLL